MSTEDTPRQVPSGGGNQHSLHDLHYRLLSQHARGCAPHVWERPPPPLPPGGGGRAEPMSPALLGSSTVNLICFPKIYVTFFILCAYLCPFPMLVILNNIFRKSLCKSNV